MEIIVFIEFGERTKHESIAILDLNINSEEQNTPYYTLYIVCKPYNPAVKRSFFSVFYTASRGIVGSLGGQLYSVIQDKIYFRFSIWYIIYSYFHYLLLLQL